jgi:site-specific DNA recombinase
MRAALYARVSSAAQRDRHTIESQLRVLREYIRSNAWELAGEYIDDGRSAKAGKLEARDGFARLQRDADAKLFDLLVVVDIDRLTRTDSMEERAAILGPFQRNGIDIVTPSGGRLDLRTFLGELYTTMQALVAAEENRKRAERIKAGKLRAIAEGRKPAGPTPFGLVYDRFAPIAEAWGIHPENAETIREIYRRVIAGESCEAISEDLHARGIPSPRGPWHRHKVWALVRSRHPAGEWFADKRKRLAIVVPAIVDEAIWSAAQQRLIEHGKRGLRRTKHVYLLEAIATCARCGSPIAIRSATHNLSGGRLNPAAYVCRARKLARRSEIRCDAPVLPVADVDARVWAKISDVLRSPDLAERIHRKVAARDANRSSWQTDAADYRARIARLAKAETGILARYRKGTISDAALDAELAALNRDRAALVTQLETAERAARDDGAAQASAEDILRELRTLSRSSAPTARQRVVRLVVPRGAAVFDGSQVRLVLEVEAGYRGEHGALPMPAVLAFPAGYRTQPGDSSDRVLLIQVVA